mgnify:CR=1 FL=1
MTYIIQQNAQNYKRKSSVRKIPDWGSCWCRNIRYNHTGRSARTPSCLGTSSACPLSGRPGSRAHRRRAYRSTRHSRGPQRTRCSCKWPTSGLRWPMPDLQCLAGSGPVRLNAVKILIVRSVQVIFVVALQIVPDAGMLAAVAAGAYGDGRIRRNEQSAHIDILLRDIGDGEELCPLVLRGTSPWSSARAKSRSTATAPSAGASP